MLKKFFLFATIVTMVFIGSCEKNSPTGPSGPLIISNLTFISRGSRIYDYSFEYSGAEGLITEVWVTDKFGGHRGRVPSEFLTIEPSKITVRAVVSCDTIWVWIVDEKDNKSNILTGTAPCL